LEWRGQDLVDPDGEKVGKLEDVYFDVASDEPVFALVSTGILGRTLTFVPLIGARVGREQVQVGYAKDRVDEAPTVDADEELSPELEAQLFHYFELDHGSAQLPTGRRLVRH
jgi:sporulation protein YlmC with PRC-barrel domain